MRTSTYTMLLALCGAVAMWFPGGNVSAQTTHTKAHCGHTIISNAEGAGKFAWQNPAAAICDEDEASAYTDPIRLGERSEFLQVTHMKFAIPESAEVLGVEVVIIRRADHSESLMDQRVQLVVKGQPVGTNEATPYLWGDNWTGAFYGGADADWGLRLSPRMINAPDFGVVLEVGAEEAVARAEVDEVLMTVHYRRTDGRVSAVQVSTGTGRWTCSSLMGS